MMRKKKEIKTTINNIIIHARTSDGWIFWTSAWEKIYELVTSGDVIMAHARYTWGHCSFYLSPNLRRNQ